MTNIRLLQSIVRYCDRRMSEGKLPATLDGSDDFWTHFNDEHANRLVSLLTSGIDSGLLSGKHEVNPLDGGATFSITIYGVTLEGLKFSQIRGL